SGGRRPAGPSGVIGPRAVNLRKLSMPLTGHLGDGARRQAVEEHPRGSSLILWILRKNYQEEAVPGRECKPWHIERWMVWHGQSIECQHAQDCRQTGKQNRRLKRHDDECRPGIVRSASNIDGIGNG